ncbi:MAG: hypothetical protein R2741_09240 [Methanolobus sp.]
MYEVRHAYLNVKIVGFKAEAGVGTEELLKRARHTLESSGLT